MAIPYWIVTRNDKYYVRHGQPWTFKPHQAAFFTRELAEQVSKRYKNSVVQADSGDGVFHKRTLEEIGEPDSKEYLEGALKLAVIELPKQEIEAIIRQVLDAVPEVVPEQSRQWTRSEIEEICRNLIFSRTQSTVFSAGASNGN